MIVKNAGALLLKYAKLNFLQTYYLLGILCSCSLQMWIFKFQDSSVSIQKAELLLAVEKKDIDCRKWRQQPAQDLSFIHEKQCICQSATLVNLKLFSTFPN